MYAVTVHWKIQNTPITVLLKNYHFNAQTSITKQWYNTQKLEQMNKQNLMSLSS